MDDNKKINDGIENSDATEKADDSTSAEALKKEAVKSADEKKSRKGKKAPKEKKLKNQAFLKRGSYSLGITAAVLAVIIVINVLVGVLSKRVKLEFDMSTEKNNSISEENVDYIKNLDTDVTVTVCADKDNYVNGYMSYYAQNLYGVTDESNDYYKQTIKLIDKYAEYNDKVTVRYIDTQDTKFTEITTKYPNDKLYYGDIIVSSGTDANERYKIVGFKDIYTTAEDSTYAAYGYSASTISANNVETAVTSAIEYVTSTESKKVALLTGHSKADYTSDYLTLLKSNNYEVDTISDSMVNSIPSDYQAVIIAAPTSDFIGSELDALSAFLDNDGKLGKGLIFFADANSPYLPNLYDFMNQWGITVGEGILFETNSRNYLTGDPTSMGSYAASQDEITNGMNYCITGYNVPLTSAFDKQVSITVTSLVATPSSVVNAPVGTAKDWGGAGDYKKQSFSTVIQADKTDYDSDNNPVSSYVMAFSSIEFIKSQQNEQSAVFNKNITLACAERAVGAEDTGISFVSKTISNESYADAVTEASTGIVRVLFMFLLPVGVIVAGIYIYIRRKNS